MTTTTVLSDDTATIVREEEVTQFDWAATLAGAAIATAVTFFLVSVGSGLGLGLTSAHHATGSGIKTFLTLGAIYFVAAQAFGLAVGGHVTGRLIGPSDDTEEENFRADAHGLAVWALAVAFGLGLLALTAGPSLTAGLASGATTTPVNYWVDKLFRPAAAQASAAYSQHAQNDTAAATAMPSGSVADAPPPALSVAPTFNDVRAEAGRLLTVVAASGHDAGIDDRRELVRLVSQITGMSQAEAGSRVDAVEHEMLAKAKDAADAARKAAVYVSIWTALALLFGAIVSVAATVSARWHDENARYRREGAIS